MSDKLDERVPRGWEEYFDIVLTALVDIAAAVCVVAGGMGGELVFANHLPV